jgi:hypothetical protein
MGGGKTKEDEDCPFKDRKRRRGKRQRGNMTGETHNTKTTL